MLLQHERLTLAVLFAIAAVASAQSTTATRVYGQGGSFTSNDPNNGGVSATSLLFPGSLAIDAGGGLYVSDENNRVLHFPPNSTTADRVYGQAGSFTSNTRNNGGVSATSLYFPGGLALDAAGGLYVTDSGNNRVLHFPPNSTTADRVYGQLGSFVTALPNHGGTVGASTLNTPTFLTVDASGLYVTDFFENRVLRFPGNSTTADRVYGQAGSFVTGIGNITGVNAGTFYSPGGVAIDASGGLYVADELNHRVLHFSLSVITADRVYGQGGSFTSNLNNNGGVSAASLWVPTDVSPSASGGVYVADSNNHRVLHYPVNSTTADRVWGQAGSFSAAVQNNGGLSATSLNFPVHLAVDSSGGLYVSDNQNHRILYFAGNISATPIGNTGLLMLVGLAALGGLLALKHSKGART